MQAYLVNLAATPTYTNPNHVSALSPVHGFHSEPQINHLDQLTGYVMIPNKGEVPSNAVVLYQNNVDCSDPTHVSKPAVVPNAVNAAKPVYNQCGQLVGYIGQVVKNSAAPVATLML